MYRKKRCTCEGFSIPGMVEGTNKGAKIMIENSNNLRNKVINLQAKIEKQKMDMGNKMDSYMNSKNLISENERIIRNKMEILNDRDRQLQLSIDRTIYSKKVIYSLLAVAISAIIIILFIFTIVKKIRK